MNINDFLSKIKACKKGGYSTGGVLHKNGVKLQLQTPERVTYTFISNGYGDVKPCRTCGHTPEKKNIIKVTFKEPLKNGLTVFQSELIYLVWFKGALPLDYASYHTCEAGKEFIQNIEEITVF